jgi:hypothetical protein
MRIFVALMLGLLCVLALVGTASLVLLAPPASAQQANRDHAEKILLPFKQDLQRALREGLSKSPVEAISACRQQAPKIAERLSQGGVRVGRTSHRLRNPENRSPEWARPILEEYLADPSARTPRTLSLPDGRKGYVEPIYMQLLCLTCHGESLATDVAAEIKRRYPRDEAVGFEAGELRGVFWLEFPVVEEIPLSDG